MSTLTTDVVVVGGGPAGSVTALLLARRGVDVLLVDRAHFPRTKPCGEYLSPGVGMALADLGLTHILSSSSAHVVRGMEIVSPHGGRFRVHYAVDGRQLPAFTMPRRDLDQVLISEAQRAGVRTLEGFVAKQPRICDGVVCGVHGSESGSARTISSRLMIIADGARSALARRLDLARLPRWPSRLGLVAHYVGQTELPLGYGQMLTTPYGYCGIAPLSDNRTNVSIVTSPSAAAAWRGGITNFYDEWLGAHASVSSVLSSATRATPVRGVGPIGARATRTWAPGALLVGDAAGFFDPFTGEGIFRALRGAEIASSIALRALARGDVSERTLGVYDAERKRAFRSKEAVTALVQLFVQFPLLMEYALPRLSARSRPAHTLSMVLGDVMAAGRFLTAPMLWASLHP